MNPLNKCLHTVNLRCMGIFSIFSPWEAVCHFALKFKIISLLLCVHLTWRVNALFRLKKPLIVSRFYLSVSFPLTMPPLGNSNRHLKRSFLILIAVFIKTFLTALLPMGLNTIYLYLQARPQRFLIISPNRLYLLRHHKLI